LRMAIGHSQKNTKDLAASNGFIHGFLLEV
jgi:hypothetical protein